MMESLFLAANNARGADGPIFAVTRYGNVSGSTGSVIPKWRALIDQGKKEVPVTDPDCTRYWMTLDEAVELVLKTVNTMHGGELVIPTLPAYRLGDLAFAMDVAMDIRGISKYEKRHESMDAGMRSDIARRMTISELQISLLCV
jgi:UDP-N-acetylglucosamine 4,6-dehydratase